MEYFGYIFLAVMAYYAGYQRGRRVQLKEDLLLVADTLEEKFKVSGNNLE